MNDDRLISNCPLCEQHSLHVMDTGNLDSQQCISCGYVTSTQFILDGQIKENSDCNIVFKIHPKILRLRRQKKLWDKLFTKHKFFPKNIEVSTKPLTEEYSRAKFFVTFSSLVGVDSLLNGIPAVATDKTSMAYGVAAKSVKEMLKNYPHTPKREQWLNNLAYKQWSMKELESGDAWKYYEPEIIKKIEAGA